MSKILLLSHGELSKELAVTARMILGEIKDVAYITLPLGKELALYQSEIEEQVKSAKDGILILTDLFGGSPFMVSTKVYAECHERYPMEIITGMNLPMILEVLIHTPNSGLKELEKIAVEFGTNGIVAFSQRF